MNGSGVASVGKTEIVIAPTNTIVEICDVLDDAIELVLQARRSISVGTYEADVEALLVFNLGIRHVEGVVALARQDLVLVPAAYHLARAAFECCIRAAWLVDQVDPLQREPRWVAHVKGEIDALKRASDRLEKSGIDVSATRRRARTLSDFVNGVAAALDARGIEPINKVPDFAQMLSSLGAEHLYASYIEASQYTHGGHGATWHYRTGGLGTEKQIGEAINQHD